MSIFGSILNKVLRKSDDIGEIGDIRSHVIGENENPYADEGPPMPTRTDVPELPEVPRFREPVSFEPTMPDRDFSRDTMPERDTNRDYDIADKLDMIEAQLSAIRSQTETINERLKNLEMRIGRRY